MSDDDTADKSSRDLGPHERATRRPLLPAAKRALAEAEDRRRTLSEREPEREIGGRGGRDPARYGDWEIKGRAIDF